MQLPQVVSLIDHTFSCHDNKLEDLYEILLNRQDSLFVQSFAMSLDWHHIIALIERWKHDTELFHLKIGGMITLHDVPMLLGLCIDEALITGNDDRV